DRVRPLRRGADPVSRRALAGARLGPLAAAAPLLPVVPDAAGRSGRRRRDPRRALTAAGRTMSTAAAHPRADPASGTGPTRPLQPSATGWPTSGRSRTGGRLTPRNSPALGPLVCRAWSARTTAAPV